MKEKLYFKDTDSTFCIPLEYHLDDARDEELEEITVFEAILDNDTSEFIWCTHVSEVTERDMCKKSECHYYESKSGRGVCKHRGKLYLHGNEVTFKVE